MSKKKIEPKLLATNADEIILLSDEELSPLRKLQQEMTILKVNLANSVMKLKRIEANIDLAVNEANDKERSYIEEAKKLAKSHGIDVDLPNTGQWNLDLDGKTLVKLK